MLEQQQALVHLLGLELLQQLLLLLAGPVLGPLLGLIQLVLQQI